jgi:hypothetical protein
MPECIHWLLAYAIGERRDEEVEDDREARVCVCVCVYDGSISHTLLDVCVCVCVVC